MGKTVFSYISLIGSALPKNYFVTFYIVVYLISPYINVLLKQLPEKSLKRFLWILIIIFSIYPSLIDCLEQITGKSFAGMYTIDISGSSRGYTIVNFILQYIVGACIRKCEKCTEKLKLSAIYMCFVLIVCGITIWSMLDRSTAWSYCNPLVILEAITAFFIFKNLTMKENRIINCLATACFSVFLLHSYFLPYINIQENVQRSIGIMCLHILISSIVIYIVCWVIWKIYDSLTKPFWGIALSKLKSMEF